MAMTLAWCGCLFLGVYLWNEAGKFTVDASPIGSMMVAAAIVLWVASIFLFGVQVGMLVS